MAEFLAELNKLLPDTGKFLASFSGSLFSLPWLPGKWWQKLHMLAAGYALSYYGGAPMAKWAGMTESTAGFFLGLFGMAFVVKVFAAIEKTQLAEIFSEWLRKALGLPPKTTKE